MSVELARANRFLGVVLFESSGPSEDPWHVEETVIVRAESEPDARVKIRAWAEAQCAPVKMPNGGEWVTRTIGVTYIFPMLFDVTDDAVTPLRVRQISDMEALRRADHRIDSALSRAMGQHPADAAREFAETISEGINFIAFVRSLSPGVSIGQQRAHFVLMMDEVARMLDSVTIGHTANAAVAVAEEARATLTAEDSRAAVRELRDAVSAHGGEVITSDMHTMADRVLAAFMPKK